MTHKKKKTAASADYFKGWSDAQKEIVADLRRKEGLYKSMPDAPSKLIAATYAAAAAGVARQKL